MPVEQLNEILLSNHIFLIHFPQTEACIITSSFWTFLFLVQIGWIDLLSKRFIFMALSYFFKIELSLTFLSASREKISLWLRFRLWTQKEAAKEGTAKHSDARWYIRDSDSANTEIRGIKQLWAGSDMDGCNHKENTTQVHSLLLLPVSQLTPRSLLQLLVANTPSLAFETGLCIQSIHDLVSLLLKMSLSSIYHRRKWRKQDDKAVKDGQDDPICTWDCSTVLLMQIEALFLNYGNQT